MNKKDEVRKTPRAKMHPGDEATQQRMLHQPGFDTFNEPERGPHPTKMTMTAAHFHLPAYADNETPLSTVQTPACQSSGMKFDEPLMRNVDPFANMIAARLKALSQSE